MKNPVLYVVFLAVLALVLAAGCTQTSPAPAATPAATTAAPAAAPSADTIRTAPSSLGTVLVDARGMTLYFFADDVPRSGASTCYNQCAQFWPVFYTPTPAVSAPLAAADFSVIKRVDGTLQTSYKGWPLYYFSKDISAGEMKGENVQGNWSVAKPDYTVMYAEQPGIGKFLTDGSGRTLYFFARENPGEVACTGTCLDNWPAFSSGPLVAPSILKTADFAVTTRPDGIRQTLYKDRLLYYFAKDAKPGDRLGEGVLNAWHVANITGYVQPEPTPVPTTIPTTVPTIDEGDTSGGGGGGDGGGY